MKKKILSISFVFLALLFFACLYHNDNIYLKFREKVNPKVNALADLDLLKCINKFAHFFDLKGTIKMLKSPMEQEDFIDIRIKSSEQKKLSEYRSKMPANKSWVNIKILQNGKYIDAKLRFHGTDLRHYNHKNSYTIKLTDPTKSFKSFIKFKLIKGEEFDPTVIAINKLANSMGLISSYGKMVVLRINEDEIGHYYFVEDIKKDFLAKNYGIKNFSILNNASDTYSRKEGRVASHISDNDLNFAHIKQTKSPLFAKSLGKYKLLTEQIKNKKIREVKDFFELDYMAKYLALAALFNDVHFMLGDNLKIIYDFDKEKFFPIFRVESGGVPIFSEYENNFSKFNSFLFSSYGNNLYSEALTLKLFKLLLSDNAFRNKRDFYFYKFYLNRDSLINDIKKTHKINEKIMLYNFKSRREYDLKKNQQIEIFNSTLKNGIDYLNYTHAYITCDTSSKKMYILLDSFSPFNIYGKNTDFLMEEVNGIEFDSNLKIKYNYQTLSVEDYSFSEKDLIFVNNLTKDSLKRRNIYINYIDGL